MPDGPFQRSTGTRAPPAPAFVSRAGYARRLTPVVRETPLLLKRFYHEGLAQASYLIGCQQTGEALVIDANRDPEPYLTAAAQHGLRVSHVTETHIHADYLSGSRELARRADAQLLLSAEGGPDWQYAFAAADRATLVHDGDAIKVGNVRIDVVHTPGHTPEHLTFVVTDTPASDRPIGAVTGDFLFVGDVGRPDLLERAAHIEGTMRAGAAQLFQSLQRFVARYPDYLQLWPGHGAGSACGKALGSVPQSTLGYEKVSNWALQITDEALFIDAVLEGQPDPPRYFATMKRLNRDGPPLLRSAPAPAKLGAELLPALLEKDSVVVDLRPTAHFGTGYIPGTLNLPLNKSFVGWAGWLLPYDRDVYFITGAAEEAAASAALELGMIGIDRVAGWFGSDTCARWSERVGPLHTIPQAVPADVEALLARGEGTLIDVRAESEWNSGHIPGAIHAPLGRLLKHVAAAPPSLPVVLQCRSGGRSSIAAALLRRHGIAAVNLAGGITAWMHEGRPVAADERTITAT